MHNRSKILLAVLVVSVVLILLLIPLLLLLDSNGDATLVRPAFSHPERVFDFQEGIQKQVAVVSKKYSDSEKIFVSISSYRDPELVHTLNDLWEKAYLPERIYVGIVQQNGSKEEDEASCFAENCKIPPEHLRIRTMHYFEGKGPTFARSICEKFLKEEKYYLLIDSHMRFEQGWDVLLVDELYRCKHPSLSVLTAYPEGYERYVDKKKEVKYSIGKRLGSRKTRFSTFTEEGLVRFESFRTIFYYPRFPPLTPFWAACFSFSLSDIVRKVPYDPNTPYLFFGEEIAMAARLFTHGYYLCAPRKNLVYHLWKREYRKTYWSHDIIYQRNESIRKVLSMLRGESNDPAFGLGTKRTLADFYTYIGINLVTNKLLRPRDNWVVPKDLLKRL